MSYGEFIPENYKYPFDGIINDVKPLRSDWDYFLDSSLSEIWHTFTTEQQKLIASNLQRLGDIIYDETRI